MLREMPLGSQRSIKGWQQMVTAWAVSKGFNWIKEDVDTMLLRMHSEISEAAESIRDDDAEGFAEELADVFIRLVNVCEVWNIDLEEEAVRKYNTNLSRPQLHGRKKK